MKPNAEQPATSPANNSDTQLHGVPPVSGVATGPNAKPIAKAVAEEILAEMKHWLHLPPCSYTASVRLFALQMPPEKLIKALWIAQSRKPGGGLPAFKYFCGVCHSMLREQHEGYRRN